MCFSASASFGAGIVLSTIGIASLKKVKQPSQIVFASIPLLFAIQQFAEGIVWLSIDQPSYLLFQKYGTYTFLFFAQVLWPIWVPYSILKLDSKDKQNTIEKILVGIGATVSIYLAYCLISFNVEAKIIGHHISYVQDYPISLSLYGGLFYLIATTAPPFFSNIKMMWALGTFILISYIITTIFYTDYIVSVWCFFASFIGLAVYVVMGKMQITNKI